MKVVPYTCSDCGTRSDSTQPLLGWCFGTKQTHCPDCCKAEQGTKTETTTDLTESATPAVHPQPCDCEVCSKLRPGDSTSAMSGDRSGGQVTTIPVSPDTQPHEQGEAR